MRGTLVLAILNVRGSYLAEQEEAVREGDVADTLQWWIGDEPWRIRTFAIDHDIHTHSLGSDPSRVLELALQNNLKHFRDVIAEQHVFELEDCMKVDDVTRALAGVGLPNRLEVAAPHFAFWKPDDARYRSQSVPR